MILEIKNCLLNLRENGIIDGEVVINLELKVVEECSKV
jgi:hypothetical protein